MQPGAVEVHDRHLGRLVPCTPALCRDEIMRGGVALSINRAPFAPSGGISGAVNPLAEPAYQAAAYSFLATFGALATRLVSHLNGSHVCAMLGVRCNTHTCTWD